MPLAAKPYETQTPEQILKLLEGGIGKDLVLYFREEQITKRYNPFLTRKKVEKFVKKLVEGKLVIEYGWEELNTYHRVVGTLKNYGKEPKMIQKDPDKYFIEFEIMTFLKDENNLKKIMKCVKKENSDSHRKVVRNACFYGLGLDKIIVEYVE